MTTLVYLIPVALFLGALGLSGFLWALRSGQYEDLDGAAERILIEPEARDNEGRVIKLTQIKAPLPTMSEKALTKGGRFRCKLGTS
jgi:cbb3-type cytochrome oxidase maturation protein